MDDCCRRIYAAGVDTTTYPFLTDRSEPMKTLQNCVRLQRYPKQKNLTRNTLNAQVKFGSTSTPENMLAWEHGRDVLDVRGRGNISSLGL